MERCRPGGLSPYTRQGMTQVGEVLFTLWRSGGMLAPLQGKGHKDSSVRSSNHYSLGGESFSFAEHFERETLTVHRDALLCLPYTHSLASLLFRLELSSGSGVGGSRDDGEGSLFFFHFPLPAGTAWVVFW